MNYELGSFYLFLARFRKEIVFCECFAGVLGKLEEMPREHCRRKRLKERQGEQRRMAAAKGKAGEGVGGRDFFWEKP